MRTVQVNLYTYEELSDAAKAKARDWYSACDAFDPEMEPYETAARILGIDFAKGRYNTSSDIRWAGFSSQGDGASFVGLYRYSAEAAQAIRAEFPQDDTLHSIADTLAEIQARYSAPLKAEISQRGHYVHSRTMQLEEYTPDDMTDDDVELLLVTMRRFANWIYICLEDDYNAQHEDEYIAEAIIANEFEFRIDGERSNG
jgi:hypothetical protein